MTLTEQARLKPKECTEVWKKLFEDSEFFFEYRDFLCVSIWAANDSDLQAWSALHLRSS